MGNENKTRMLREIAKHYGIERNVDFAQFFELEPATSFQRFKNGFIDFEQVYEKCPDISPDWLLNGGQGPMLRKDRENGSHNINIGEQANQHISVQDCENLRMALEALSREQAASARAQEQVSALIELLGKKGQ